MTARELELYKKCMRKKPKYRTQAQFNDEHEYDNSINENDYDR